MFDYMTGGPRKPRSARLTTAALSAIAHIVVLVALIVPVLYATDTLPEPRTAIAFFVSAPPPPPPPPPPAPAVTTPAPAKSTRTAPVRHVTPRPVAAAPVEAPAAITPETGAEGMPSADALVDAGFEGGVPGGVVGGVIGGIENAPPVPPPAPPPARAPIRVGGEIVAPRLIHRVEPEYPLLARQAQVQGLVILEATVDHEGYVNEVRVLRSHSVLQQAAVDAVQQWRYEPLMLNGAPQPFVLTVTVSFSLPATR
jgi:protein TonB